MLIPEEGAKDNGSALAECCDEHAHPCRAGRVACGAVRNRKR